ncbi:Gfo/Idh/MocA family oxidoreductase [Salinibacterium sp. TMP30]|uniref:Gfo/Idh/MocA family protein n=1 Tax=Salinibacterium sp. TMP30 TaxID=3138237 RepID=UPI00313A286D
MIRVGVVGLGKMGLSHLSMIRAHPEVSVDGVVDSAGYILGVLSKYTGLKTFTDFDKMLQTVELDAVLIATPTRFHAAMVRTALEHGLHVFCEKPLTLTSTESSELAELASARGLVTQVGYHNRFVGTFREAKRLLEAGAIGRVTHLQAESYGPVVLKAKGSTWRSKRTEGGGCLYDYAAHPLDLATWFVGDATGVGGTILGSIFSENTEDEVYSTIYFADGVSGQLSVNWSDESYRKMTTRMSIFGTQGKIIADRQEIQVYLRSTAPEAEGYPQGWNIKSTTELTDEVWFYLRGEEYSAQLDHFVRRIHDPSLPATNDFASAAVTDRIIELLTQDAAAGPAITAASSAAAASTPTRRRSLLGRRS